MTSLLGSGRRCHFARAAVALASSLDFLQGTFEKIHLQGLSAKAASSDGFPCDEQMRACWAVTLLVLVQPSPASCALVEAPRSHPSSRANSPTFLTSLHARDSHSLKFPGVPLSLHCGSFPGNCAPFLCVSSRFTQKWGEPLAWKIHDFRGTKASPWYKTVVCGGFETKVRPSLDRTYHNRVFALPDIFERPVIAKFDQRRAVPMAARSCSRRRRRLGLTSALAACLREERQPGQDLARMEELLTQR